MEFYEELYRRYNQDAGFVYQSGLIELPNGLKFITGSEKSPSFVLDEIFLMKVYGEPDLNGRTAIDVGASIADSTLYFAKLGASKIIAFEPNQERFETAQKNIELNNFSKIIEIHEYGLGGGEGDMSLEKLISEIKDGDIFLKIDCDGCEYEMLSSTSDSTFSKISEIVMEYHAKASPLISRLEGLGYRTTKNGEMIRAVRSA